MKQLVKAGHLNPAESDLIVAQAHMDLREFHVRRPMDHGSPMFEFNGRLLPGAGLERLKSLLEANKEKFKGHAASLFHVDGFVSLIVQVKPEHQKEFSNLYKFWYGRLLRSV